MVYHLALECIGENSAGTGKFGALSTLFFGKQPSRSWVAKVKYIRGKYVDREFIQGKKDYTHANGPGTRGVYKHYFLDDGLYEINSPQSWKSDDRYFAFIEDGEMWRVTREEAEIWVNDYLE